ncbi:MAG: NosD domain-containing protein [Nanoarchaeota archaeon]|nr:NosD domain-containing protein [Nanoarchaeota archaeon]
MKKVMLLIPILFLIVFPLVNAEILYQDGDAIVKGRHHIRDIKDTNFLEIKDNICYLKKPVKVANGAALYISNSSCIKLNMYAESMITVYGGISFNDVIVTSYNPETGEPIELTRTNYSTRRPDITTKAGATHFNARNTEFSYLGYYYNYSDSHWGVTLRYTPRAFITNSKFHHNYFGFYTFDSKNVQVKNSEVYDNLEYGLDFHDFSDNFYIYNNTVYRNGNHGIIFSKFCDNNVIAKNRVFDHTQNAFVKGVEKTYGVHGIMLHKQSNNNSIERNELWNNRVAIQTDDSHNNIILKNIVHSDIEEGMILDESTGNQIIGNEIIASDEYALFTKNSIDNYYQDNEWGGSSNQIYFRIFHSDGTAFRYKQAGTSDADAKLNELSQMEIA